jgi:hypothetical protein
VAVRGRRARDPGSREQGSEQRREQGSDRGPDITVYELVPLNRPSERRVKYEANVLFHPDGRVQLSTDVVQMLWGKSNPHAKKREQEFGDEEADTAREEGRSEQLYLRMFAKGPVGGRRPAEELILVAAEKGEPGAIVAGPVGRKEIRWPKVYVFRAAPFIRRLGIYGHVRCRARRVKLGLEDGRAVDAVAVDLRSPIEGSTDDVRECLQEWMERAEPGKGVPRKEFLDELKAIAAKKGVPITRRQVEDYVRSHRASLRQMGLEFVLSGKTTFKEVIRRADGR